MRVFIWSAAFGAIAGTAFAGSIDTITTTQTSRSIVTVTCPGCGAVESQTSKQAPVAELKPGTSRIEVREVDGEMKAFRTEAWMGGSPVVVVSKATADDIRAAGLPTGDPADKNTAENHETPPDMIDATTTTSAVKADLGATADGPAPKPAFDPSSLELRLN
jgi:hypothetical protein